MKRQFTFHLKAREGLEQLYSTTPVADLPTLLRHVAGVVERLGEDKLEYLTLHEQAAPHTPDEYTLHSLKGFAFNPPVVLTRYQQLELEAWLAVTVGNKHPLAQPGVECRFDRFVGTVLIKHEGDQSWNMPTHSELVWMCFHHGEGPWVELRKQLLKRQPFIITNFEQMVREKLAEIVA